MEFVFMCLTQRLTSELSKWVRYRVEHNKQTSKHVLFCLSYVYQGPALTDMKISIKDLGWRMVNIHQPIWLARKASDVSAADWRYQTHVKNYRDFTYVQLQHFSELEILAKYCS